MDGATLLDGLSDWTAESHPNVSVKTRQDTNNLMGELRTELFTLLGSTTQVGGSTENNGDISIVQPIDEELVRQMSPAELKYTLNLAESGWQGMVGGSDENGNGKELIPYTASKNQLGGAADSDIGWLQKTKIMMGLRKFNQFIDEFEALRAQISKNMAGYEVEVARGETVTNNIVKAIRDMFLNKKFEAMWRLMMANEAELQTDKNPVKREIMQRRIDSATQEIKRLSVVLAENVEEANKIFLIKSWFSGYKESRGVAFWQENAFIVKIISEVNAQQKAYLALNKEFNYYVKEVERAKNLKALEAAVANKNVSELTKFQRKEIAEYQKNREKYEKMFAFSDTRRNEYEELMNKKEKIVDKLNFYKTTITAGIYFKNQTDMQKTLTTWEGDITNVYQQISNAIDQSGTYKKALDELRQKIANNGNIMDGLVAGMAELEDIKKIYVKFLDNAEKAYEIQEGIGNALKEIKRKFIELIPDASLLPDMHRVVSAQSFVVSLTRILSNTLTDLGTNEQKARDRLKDKIKQMKGGSPTNDLALTYYANGGISGISGVNLLNQTGGMQTGGVYDMLIRGPEHGNAFYEHDNAGRVWSQNSAAITEGYKTASAAGEQVKILTLPYGVRKISDDYVNMVNNAIDQIANDKVIYIPVINYKRLTFDHKGGGYTYELFTAVYDSSAIRITGHSTRVLSSQRNYNQIHGNYYVYNILEYNGPAIPAKDRDFINLLRTTCDRNNDMRLNGDDYIILPVFYKLGTGTRTVSNPLFDYDEYVLLHPLLGGVMTATLRESDLAPMRYVTAGPSEGYEFTENLGGQPPKLNLTLKLQQKRLANVTALSDAAPTNFDYYYNFCGPNIIIKAQLASGQPHFTTINFSNLGRARVGNLQPTNPINVTSPINYAKFAFYMFQLMGHLNELCNKLSNIKIFFTPAVNITPVFATGNYTIYGKYNFDYDLDDYNQPKRSLLANITSATQLDMIGSSKSWDNTYADNFFGAHEPAKLAVIFLPMKVLIADLIYWMTNGTIAMGDAKTKTGTALALYKSAYTAAATIAGVPASAIPTPGGGTGTTGAALTPLNPRYNQRLDYVNKRLTPGSAYFNNLVAMDGICKKFAAPEFQVYSENLYKAYETMSIIRTYENKILDIKPAKDEFTLPEFSLITKNLEPKVEPGSKDAYTNAGQKLYDKLKENKTYLAQNEYAVNSDNLVRDLDDVLWQISKLSNIAKDWNTISFFSIPPGDKYVDILSTQAGATKFISQLQADKKWQHHETLGKISHAMQLILRLDPINGQAYNIFETIGHASTNKEHVFKAKKKGKYNKKDKSRHGK